MRKLMLAASLCVASILLVPIASASAEKTAGRCTITGRATFSPTDLKPLPTSELGYEFAGRAECERLPSREIINAIVEAGGKQTLSCFGALGETEGTGTMTVGSVKLPFSLTFLSGGPGSTLLAVKFADGGTAVGGATFLNSSSELASQCFTGGAHDLEFEAVASGEL